MKSFPWHLLGWSILGAVVLRPVFEDDTEYMLACLIYALVLGFVSSILDIKEDK